MTKHSEGPWRVTSHYKAGRGEKWNDIINQDRRIIATIRTYAWSSAGECESNAKLIAAAPELLEALRELNDFAAPTVDYRYTERSVAAFQAASALLRRLGG